MSSAKSSRSRASAPSGVISAGSGPGGGGGALAQDGGGAVQLTDKLKIFKTDNFDPDAYVQSKCQTMNEKDIKHLCSYLHELKKASAEEMRRSVYANYAAFIRTSKEISDLEGELLSIRNLLSTQAALIHNLAEGVHVDSLSAKSEGSMADDISNVEDREPSDTEKWLVEFPDTLDVLLAERRVDEALDALDEAERIAADAKENKKLRPADIMSLQTAITDHRQKLADQLAEAACQSSTRGVELRAAASALKRLGDGHRAHTLLLNAHNQRLQYNMQTIHPTSTSYGGAYTAALSQQVFSAIAQAVNDSLEVFGNESAYLSELVTWSTKQTEAFAQLVLRHALASSAAAGGLRAAAECVQIAIGHCSLLENRGLALSSVLMNLFKPSVELALAANLKRIEESTAALAAADDWVLVYPPSAPRTSSRGASATSNVHPKLSSSAHRFNSMVQDFFEDVGPLLSMQLGGSTLNGLLKVFNSYVNLLINALPGSMEDEQILEGSGNKLVRMADTEMQQLALLANASLLAEDLLPRAAVKLSPLYQGSGIDEPRKKTSDRQNRMPEQREWKRKLQRTVDRLRDSFCRQHALDLIFAEDGGTYLSAEMYINMDNVDDPEWSPSPIFQELFAKLNRMSIIVADMFVGRERFATLLLMRLIETVILWLSEDQTFWEEIEQGPRPLGPKGLVQFYLDMQFVIVFGQGRYLSRHVHQVIIDIIDKAMNAFSAAGQNPDEVLPADDWFIGIAEETISKISGKYAMANGEREAHSPTASVSALSMSSVRSHGSS
ncbi:exocyst complex component EXO84B-like [Iris pallida]|uniref:Exocyst complex component EXO84B-like n=1 Tax=Iris pallida TaxID=29817 RepID=A0AAX6DNQ6_IRIPA|nr:exocyst complex component EXO84B-like [Iris pallida]